MKEDLESLRIGLDVDEVLADFWGAYSERFDVSNKPRNLEDHVITKNVYKIKDDKKWWTSLDKLRDIDFIPECYCTKRISNKQYTIEWLDLHGFPKRPVYQMVYQKGDKSKLIKGKVDIFIDDSIENFEKCTKAGIFTLLLTTPRNRYYETNRRISDLNYWDIVQLYGEENFNI